MNITLIGFMGTGKTTVGKRLAKRLGWRFVDVDEQIETSAKKPVPRIFAEHGEPVFRRLEERIVRRLVRGDQQVIATGGGAFVDPKNRSRLRASGPVVCLTARPKIILQRLGRRIAARPLLQGGDPLERIKTLLARRAKAYAKADAVIDTSDLSAEQVVERLWGDLSPGLCKSWQYLLERSADLAKRYGGKYVVVAENRVVACGDSQLEAFQNASQRLDEKREAGIYYIPLPEESLTALFIMRTASGGSENPQPRTSAG
ncbi:MAG: AAA family ATPase [Candidatus Omnitrophica bacterium]|nr:AAA family ATPase [Candidatus Omnitrophota bacterium]